MTVRINDSANVTFSTEINCIDDAMSLINILSVLKRGTKEFDVVNNAVYFEIARHLDGDCSTSEWDDWFRVLGYLESVYAIKEAERNEV